MLNGNNTKNNRANLEVVKISSDLKEHLETLIKDLQNIKKNNDKKDTLLLNISILAVGSGVMAVCIETNSLIATIIAAGLIIYSLAKFIIDEEKNTFIKDITKSLNYMQEIENLENKILEKNLSLNQDIIKNVNILIESCKEYNNLNKIKQLSKDKKHDLFKNIRQNTFALKNQINKIVKEQNISISHNSNNKTVQQIQQNEKIATPTVKKTNGLQM